MSQFPIYKSQSGKKIKTCLLISEIWYFISKAGFILFYFILFYFIPFHFMLFYFVYFYTWFIFFYFILFYYILFYYILFYFILFHSISFYFILFIFTSDSFLKFSDSFHFNLFLHPIHIMFVFQILLFSKFIVITLSKKKSRSIILIIDIPIYLKTQVDYVVNFYDHWHNQPLWILIMVPSYLLSRAYFAYCQFGWHFQVFCVL